MDSSLAKVALRSGLLVTKDGIKAERDRLQDALDCFKLEKELLMKLLFEKDVIMMAMSTCFVDMMKQAAKKKTDKGLLAKSNKELHFSCNSETGEECPHGR